MTVITLNHNLIRIVLLLILAVINAAFVLYNTPELKGVQNSTYYRACVWLVLMRGCGFFLFDMLGLFPLPE